MSRPKKEAIYSKNKTPAKIANQSKRHKHSWCKASCYRISQWDPLSQAQIKLQIYIERYRKFFSAYFHLIDTKWIDWIGLPNAISDNKEVKKGKKCVVHIHFKSVLGTRNARHHAEYVVWFVYLSLCMCVSMVGATPFGEKKSSIVHVNC